jgi:hypothetical protein
MTEEEAAWAEACQADAEIPRAEFDRMVEEARPHLLAWELEREASERSASYVTYSEASRIFRLSVGTIRERAKRDGVEVIGTGGAHRVHLESLRRALIVRPAHHREPVKSSEIGRRRRPVAPDRTFTRLSRAPVTQTRGGGA